MKKIEAKDMNYPVFNLKNDWLMLSAAKKDGTANGMTCSWGGMGVLWGKDVVFIFVRRSRYTMEFMDEAETFSLSWFDDPGHKLLGYFGKASGRDEDKIAKAGLTMTLESGAPVYAEATRTILCRKLFKQEMSEASFIDRESWEKWYADGNVHDMFVGEILSVEEKGE